jgi:DNA-binding GntR family transcriptional regulator
MLGEWELRPARLEASDGQIPFAKSLRFARSMQDPLSSAEKEQERFTDKCSGVAMAGTEPKKTLARHRAYEAIKDKILYLELRPGDIISEGQIAKRLDIGRTPAREALLLLEREGLIEIRENVGFTARAFGLEEIEEYRLIRAMIEEYAITMAIQRITEDELEALRENIRNLAGCLGDNSFMQASKYASEFHEIIYRAARSDVVRETIAGLNSKFLWIRAAAMSSKRGIVQCVTEHSLILEQVEKKDIGKAKKYMRKHIKSGWRKLAEVTWLFRSTVTGRLDNNRKHP